MPMTDGRPFHPIQNTIRLTAATSAPVGVHAELGLSAIHLTQVRIHNSGAVTAFVTFSTVSGADAQSKAVIPTGTGANSKFCWPIPPGAIEIFTAPPSAYWSAITASGSADLYLTPGEGM